MAKHIEVVSLDDVYPLADDYGNEYAQRDHSLKVNQEYVAELAESMRRKGEPDEPITVIPEGGIYYVKVGRSRYEAMKLLGTAECEAVVDDDTSRQAAIEAIVRTDVKKKYEDVEKSRMVQQLMMFGDDQYVSETAGIPREKARRIRRAAKRVDDAAEDMTLGRLLLIEEFSDDPDAVERLSSCKESEAESIAATLRRNRDVRKAKEAFAAAFRELGVGVAEDRGDVEGMRYFVFVPEPAEAAKYLPPQWEPGQVTALLSATYGGARAELYVAPELSADEDEREAELRRMQDAYEEAIDAMDGDRASWFWERLAKGEPMPNLLRACTHGFETHYAVKEAMRAMGKEALAAAKNRGLSLFDYALGYGSISSSGKRFGRALAQGEVPSYYKGALVEYVDELRLYEDDGWDPGESGALIALLVKIARDSGAKVRGGKEDGR